MKLLATLALFAVVGCNAAAAPAPPAVVTPAVAAPTATPLPTIASVVAPAQPPIDETPATGDSTYRTGDVVTVTEDNADWADISVTDVSVHSSYGHGFLADKPSRGNVYIQAFVKYVALTSGVDFNPFDWQVFVNGEAVDNGAFVTEGPRPTLSYGTLPEGRKGSGWVVYEVPAHGEVRMSYAGNTFLNDGPVFEVIIRAK